LERFTDLEKDVVVVGWCWCGGLGHLKYGPKPAGGALNRIYPCQESHSVETHAFDHDALPIYEKFLRAEGWKLLSSSKGRPDSASF